MSANMIINGEETPAQAANIAIIPITALNVPPCSAQLSSTPPFLRSSALLHKTLFFQIAAFSERFLLL